MSLIHQKLSVITSQINPVPKNGLNKEDGYKFKNNEDIYKELHPLLKREGVFITPEVLESSETIVNTTKGRVFRIKVKVKWTFSAQDGSSWSGIMLGEALDPSDKASNKAMTASLKYLLIYMFLIPAQYMPDADSTSIKIIPFDDLYTENNVGSAKSLLAFAESKGVSRVELAKIGQELGINTDAELSAQDRKKLFQKLSGG